VELAAVDALTGHRDPAVYRNLADLVDQIERAFGRGNVDAVLDAHQLFHASLVAATGSPPAAPLPEYIAAFPVPASVTETISPDLPAGPPPGRMTLLYQAVADAVARAARPLLLSGDCPAALGAVAGLQRRHRDLAVVWLDAHGDFNTPAITISGYLGGMPLAMLTGRAPELFCEPLGLRPVADTDVVLADARDLDPAERDALTASHVRRVPADPAAISSALAGLGRLPVYLHLDVDVIDSGQLPGLRFPAGPGPSVTQIEKCLGAVCTT
jgi:arginase